jgi:AraC-like DNA-binding protein
MKPCLEKVTSSPLAFTAYVRNDSEFPFQWHYHSEYELTLILDSHGQRMVGDGIAEYGPGDLVLLGPNLPHSWCSGPLRSSAKELNRALVVQFREDFLGQHFFQLSELDHVSSLLQRSANGLAFGHTEAGRKVASYLVKILDLPPAQRLLCLLSALVELAGESHAYRLSSLKLRPICRAQDQRRIDAICRYLSEHFEEKFDFIQLCKHFHMTQAAMCRFFKRATGRTLTTYLNELRVDAAIGLLLHTDESILNICFRVGFGNYSNFHKQFTRIKGVGPRLLRKQLTTTRSSVLESVSPMHLENKPLRSADAIHKLEAWLI